MSAPGPLAHVDKKSAAQVLEQIASFLELKGENPFRIRAFRTASKTIAGLPGELAPALADGTNRVHQGHRASHAADPARAGHERPRLAARGPARPGAAGLVDMLQIPGLGVAKIRQIHDTLRIDSVAELEEAAIDGSLAKLPRFGQKTAGEHPPGHPLPAAGERVALLSTTRPRRRKPCAWHWASSGACARPSSPATCGDAPRSYATSSSCSVAMRHRPSSLHS
jgi:hypothetical protein